MQWEEVCGCGIGDGGEPGQVSIGSDYKSKSGVLRSLIFIMRSLQVPKEGVRRSVFVLQVGF